MSTLTYSDNISELYNEIQIFFEDEIIETDSKNFLREEIEEYIEEFIENEILNWRKIRIKIEEWENNWNKWNSITLDYIFKILGVEKLETKRRIKEIFKNYFLRYSGFKLDKKKDEKFLINKKVLIDDFQNKQEKDKENEENKDEDDDDDDDKDFYQIKKLLPKEIVSKFLEDGKMILNRSGYFKIIRFLIPHVKKINKIKKFDQIIQLIKQQLGEDISKRIKEYIKVQKRSKILSLKFEDIKIKNDLLQNYILIIEYLLGQIIKISQDSVKEKKKRFITEEEVDQAICFDDNLVHLYDEL